MTTPIDAEVRRRAATEITTSLALTAGAGSGKTTVLVDRVLALLESGVPPRRIAAITFTEKAAGELELRVRDTLERRLASGGAPPALGEAIRSLGEMQLSTIHSFCQLLLVEEALDAAWNPDAEIVDAAFSADATNRAFDAWWRRFESDHPDAALLLHEVVTDHSLRAMAGLLMNYRDLTPVIAARALDWDALDASLLACHAELRRCAARCAAPAEDKLLAANAAVLLSLDHATQRGTPTERVSFAAALPLKTSRAGGKAADWGGSAGKEAFIEALDAVKQWAADVGQALHGLVVTHLRTHFVAPALALKAESGEYDFQDLLFQSAKLLASNRAARARLGARYDAILIDEVQDTDPIQAEVAMLLARDTGLDGPWDAHPPRPGALFAVGDPKQSIYRFRRADVHTWRALRDAIADEGRALSLTTNFRSVPEIVEWVNVAFAELPEYSPQAAHRAPAELDPVVLVEAGDLDPDAGIVRHLMDLHTRGARVIDRENGELRPMSWGDVMVLLPSWGAAAGLQSRLLRCGVDAVVEGGASFFARDETRLLLAAMRAIEEPADAEATVFVLRGLFGFDHQALLDFVSANGTWRYTMREQPKGRVAEALDILRALHFRRDRQSWVNTLEELLDECWAPAVWAGMLDGKARLANVAKLYSLVRQAERVAPTSGDALRAMLELAGQDDERELPVVDFDADALRITTYFSAKGLEAPIVVLAHSHRSLKMDHYGAAASVDRDARTVALRVSGLEPAGWADASEREKAEYLQEQRRWLYVAATRARDQLVIVRSARDKLLDHDIARGLPPIGDAEHGARHEVGGAQVTVLHAADLVEPEAFDGPFPGLGDIAALLDAGTVTTHSTLQAREDRLREAIGRSRRQATVWSSVGQLVKKSRRARKYEEGVGAAGGTVVHLVMANLDLTEPPEVLRRDVPALLDAFAASEGLNRDIRDRCFRILDNMIQHPVVARARVAPERWVEAPFTFKEDGRIVSGIIDLCFPVDEARTHWVVVDWKSNLPPTGTPERESYEAQLEYYGRALIAAVTPCTHIETVLVGPHPELLPPDALTEALELVDEDLAEALARLAEAGVPVPEIGLDVGEPVVGTLELAWPARLFGIAVDATLTEMSAMRDQGWTLVAVDTTDPDWTEAVLRRVAAAFGAALEPDDDVGQEPTPVRAEPPPVAAVVPAAQSSLRGTPGVVQVNEGRRIAYAHDLPRVDMLALVARGWIVVDYDESAHAPAPAWAADIPFDEDEIVSAWALRFDGWTYMEETGFQPPTDRTLLPGGPGWGYTPLEELAILFAEQRYHDRWVPDPQAPEAPTRELLRRLFLRVAGYDVPPKWRAPERYERWDRLFRRHQAACIALIEAKLPG